MTTTTNWFACVPFPQAETPSEANMDPVDAAETTEDLANNEVDVAVEPASVEKDEPVEVDNVYAKSCSPSTYTATTEDSLADEARDDETDGAQDDASVLSAATSKIDTEDVIKEERDCEENEALKTKNASNDGPVESSIDEAALTAEDVELTLSGSGFRTNPSTSFDKCRSISANVKNGSIAATTKTGALVKAMHVKMKMTKKEVPQKEDLVSKKGIVTKVAMMDALNATVKKMRAAKEVPKSESSSPNGEVEFPINKPACSSSSPPVVITMPKSPKSASSYDYFQVVFSGNKKTDMMVRLPYNVNTTFQDLRRELEEDFANDLGSSYFKFTITADGIIVSPAQEQKWRIRDYDLTNQGGDGTYKSPFFVYVKKESSKMKRMSLSIKQMRM